MIKKVSEKKEGNFFEAVGRRKTAIARVRLHAGKNGATVNGKTANHYFPVSRFLSTALAPLERLNLEEKYSVEVKVKGGGVSSQAGAVRHGLARALATAAPDTKKRLRALGFLTRDPRMVERKKYGLKKARRAPQWAKR